MLSAGLSSVTGMSRRGETVMVSVAGVVVVALYATWAAVQILVLNPLAAVPGVPLGEIHATMTAQRQWQGAGPVLMILGFGVLMAVILAGFAIAQRVHPIVPTMSFLVLLLFGAPAYFIASFGPGMGLADTYMIGGADASPWARPLYAISITAGILLIVGTLTVALRSRRGRVDRAAASVTD